MYNNVSTTPLDRDWVSMSVQLLYNTRPQNTYLVPLRRYKHFQGKAKTKTMALINKYIAITSHVEASPQDSHFEVRTEPFSLSPPAQGDVIIKNLYVSVDPYQLNRMKSFSSSQGASDFAGAIEIGKPIACFGVGRVVASKRPGFEKDDVVSGLITWGEYCVAKEGDLITKFDPAGFPLSHYVGILGNYLIENC